MTGRTDYPRIYKIQAHASEHEFRAWKTIALLERRKPAEALRALVRRRARELGIWPSAGEEEEQSARR